MTNMPLVIGYTLEKALKLLNNDINIIIKTTMTIFEDKKSERAENAPIVVRQIVKDNNIELTTSLFG